MLLEGKGLLISLSRSGADQLFPDLLSFQKELISFEKEKGKGTLPVLLNFSKGN